jgi:hypothetical protein
MIKKKSDNKIYSLHFASEKLKDRAFRDKQIRKWKSDYHVSLFTNILLMSFLIVFTYYIGVNNNRINKTIDLDNFLLSAKSDKISELGMEIGDQEANNTFLSERLAASEMELNYYMKEYERCENDYNQLYDYAGRYMENDFGFLDIAKDNADNHIYDVHNYNCVDFSNDFVTKEREAGYQARTFRVRVNCTSDKFSAACVTYGSNGHMIATISLPIEPQTGKIIPVTEYDDYGIDRDLL